jgi:hypothetical protein
MCVCVNEGMLRVIAARRCMHVWECVLHMLTAIAARRCMHVWEFVFGLVQGAWSRSLLRGDACVCLLLLT